MLQLSGQPLCAELGDACGVSSPAASSRLAYRATALAAGVENYIRHSDYNSDGQRVVACADPSEVLRVKQMDSRPLSALLSCCDSFAQLSELRLMNCGIDQHMLLQLCPAIAALQRVRFLSLRGNDLRARPRARDGDKGLVYSAWSGFGQAVR